MGIELLSGCLKALGLKALGSLGRGLGRLLYALGFRRKIVAGNLSLALGKELSAVELQRLMAEFYGNLGLTFLEIARNFSLTREEMRKEMRFSPEQKARLSKLAAQGKGAVMISGHIANWELLGMGAAAHGNRVAIVVKKMNNALSQALVERRRASTGLEIIYSGRTLEKMKAVLKEGKFIGFMMDQNVTGTKGIRTEFFGVPAATIRGLASLVRETGTPVIPICSYRLPDGTHEFFLGEELPYLRDESLPEGSPERLLREEWLNTQQYQSAIERMVRAKPAQWLWIHRRWKCPRDPLVKGQEHLKPAY